MFWVALHLPGLQAAMLEPLAAWACQFTPRVALEPEALLLEVAGSLRYFGGAARRQEALLAALECGLAELGVQASLATASTARAALWRARGGGLPFEELPVSVMGGDATFFRQIGVARIGERSQGAARFGRARRRAAGTAAAGEARHAPAAAAGRSHRDRRGGFHAPRCTQRRSVRRPRCRGGGLGAAAGAAAGPPGTRCG